MGTTEGASEPEQEGTMGRYVVKFVKRVSGDNGYQREACQFLCDVDAPDEPTAIEKAKQRFCRENRLTHWTLHADEVRAAAGDFPS